MLLIMYIKKRNFSNFNMKLEVSFSFVAFRELRCMPDIDFLYELELLKV